MPIGALYFNSNQTMEFKSGNDTYANSVMDQEEVPVSRAGDTESRFNHYRTAVVKNAIGNGPRKTKLNSKSVNKQRAGNDLGEHGEDKNLNYLSDFLKTQIINRQKKKAETVSLNSANASTTYSQ